jgi:transposase
VPSMPQSSVPSQTSSDPDEVVVGVDTHKDVHVAAVLTALGVLRESKKFPATAAGYQALLAWVGTFGYCGGPGWSAPAPTVRRWPGTCGRPGSL